MDSWNELQKAFELGLIHKDKEDNVLPNPGASDNIPPFILKLLFFVDFSKSIIHFIA